MAESITKTQRWLDLISLLLGRTIPLSVEEILERIPAYASGLSGDETARASVRRMFERDKDELRKLGIPLETVDYAINSGLETLQGYRIARRDFYLPYLRLLRSEAPAREEPAPGSARGIAELELGLSEMQDAVDALTRVAELPAFPFAEDARAALQKITFDAPPEGLPGAPVRWIDPPGTGALLETLEVLSAALLARKRVRFLYHGIQRGEPTERNVAPYGLFFQRDWYLVGGDVAREGEVRVFRAARIEAPAVNPRSPKSPDYTIPGDFQLSDYLDRSAWMLGEDEDTVVAEVHFPFPAAVWAERNGEGELVRAYEDGSSLRRFEVRQPEPFLRWVLSQGGDARLVGPPALRERLGEMLTGIEALYAGGADA